MADRFTRGNGVKSRDSRRHYYTPVYIPKASTPRSRRLRLLRRCIPVALAAVILAVSVFLWQSGRKTEDSVIEVSAARQTLREVSTYPRIVDSEAPLSRNDVPADLVSLNTLPNGASVCLRADAAERFLAMVDAMAADGMAIIPIRGYVSYDEQSAVLEEHIDKYIADGASAAEAREQALREYAAPGESEAQLGTLIDVSTDLSSVDRFAATDQYLWLCENAPSYGFIIRKASQPWRLRYVGVDTAQTMRKVGLSLDDYVQAVREENSAAVQESN
ncbi:MAG: M15 family metallopeptidase [Clostridia bacterium]|nr:M15 family metallopeptidase [Clostridia bacterium]